MVQVTECPTKSTPPSRPISLRFRFRKVGRLMYVSHLDLVRTFGKIVVRSGLPLWYTEGFNPKPKMVFSPPLSIGAQSECEYLDLRLTERVDPAAALTAMNACVTDELRMLDAYYPTCKLTDIRYMSYDVHIHTLGASEELAARCERILLAEDAPFVKTGKGGEKTVNLRPMIEELSVRLTGEELHMQALLDADSATFLNPERLITVLRERTGILSGADLRREWVSIRRTGTFRADRTPFV